MDLIIEDLKKIFRVHAMEVPAVHGVSFTVPQGKLFTLLGPSGSGKTTVLRCIGGLEMPDSGEIRQGDKVFFSDKKRIVLMPEERNIGMVFQSYAIWPHMTVFNNVAFPLLYGIKHFPKGNIKSKVNKVLNLIHMEHLGSRMATQLSGGQQQRVALARALVSEPDLLLLDEPLSNLDAKLREEMRIEIRRIQKSLNLTTVYVTHDQSEALSMSDQIALLRNGKIVQLGAPRELYEKPANFFTSSFIGDSNRLPGKVHRFSATGSLGSVMVQGREFACIMGQGCSENSDVVVSIRPEDIDAQVNNDNNKNETGWKGVVRHVLYNGENLICEIDFAETILRAKLHPSVTINDGEQVQLSFKPERCVAFPPDTTT